MEHTTDDAPGRPSRETQAAPDLPWPTEGHLGRAGDPVEGRDPDLQPDAGDEGGIDVSDHLGPAGDPVEGA
jgi:hypothetical protein